VPQAAGLVPGWHTPSASQQPLAHEVASQTQEPALQRRPAPQAMQSAPPVPHEALLCEAAGTHTLPAQQPSGHEVALQTQEPLSHAWPAAHAPQAAPPAPHTVGLWPEAGTQVLP
jgi:hypothetical protein